jgi:NADH dehydrogenase [ubiquinone] 1 alpha subcomplex assembly factor 2
MGVRAPPLDTERRVGPGSKVAAEAGAAGPGKGGRTLGDDGAVNQREATWKEMKRKAGSEGGKSTAEEVEGPNPWKQARGGPSETWQPQGWEPAAKGKKK